jgi:hypothetical protein
MNQHKLGLNLRTASAWGDSGRKPLRARLESVLRIRAWLAEGLCAARERPLVWLATILLSADLATALELCTPLPILATLLVPVVAGATISMREYGRNADRSTVREALFALALIVSQRCSSLEAITTSLRAVLRNWSSVLCYVLLISADVVAAPFMPMIVRGLVVTPFVSALIVLSIRGSYRDIIEHNRNAPSVPARSQ